MKRTVEVDEDGLEYDGWQVTPEYDGDEVVWTLWEMAPPALRRRIPAQANLMDALTAIDGVDGEPVKELKQGEDK